MGEWISVKDRLPEDNKLVLLYTKNPYGENDFLIGYRGRRKLFNGEYGPYEWVVKHPCSSSGITIDERGNPYLKPRTITNWIPLPEPPIGGEP